jgi:pyruvate kinase
MQPELQPLIHELEDLHAEMLTLVQENLPVLDQIHPENQSGANNLLHYLALRRHDVRGLQDQLTTLGLSSLGRTESNVLSSVRAVMTILSSLRQGEPVRLPDDGSGCSRDQGHQLLERNTEFLLGPTPEGRKVRIMVTMPSEAANDYELVRDLVIEGMNCMRINCAHDGEEAWSGMIRNLRRAEQETGKNCKIEMDVAGPKLRTGPMEPGPTVVKYRPKRDAFGRIETPARIWLTPTAHPEAPPSAADACIPVSGRWLSSLGAGDLIRFTDTRGARRSMEVTEAVGNSRWAEGDRTGYVTPGAILTAVSKDKHGLPRRARVGHMPPKPQTLLLRPGDTLILTRSLEPGQPAQFNEHLELASPAHIGVTLPEFFDSVQADQPIWFDDGKIGGIISDVGPDQVTVKITHARAEGDKLAAEKGINVPETNLRTASLTTEDLQALAFIVKNADLLGYSFVRTEDDVRLLQSHLTELGAGNLGIVLKIETREGFDNLPRLLLAASRSRSVGVMIARGDLAIECGYERLAEAQEEILWISEAAHVPVIWATQVLETLAKTGTPSRSEITDAAMGERAECVMLNKGPYVVEAVRTLDDILGRMQAHQEKKRSMLRKLGVAAGFAGAGRSPQSAGSL